MRKFREFGKRFTADDRGATAVEGVFASIFLIWWYISAIQFFDALRNKNSNQKATFAIADLLSRETGVLTASNIEGLNTMFNYLAYSKQASRLRVTSLNWDANSETYQIIWSKASGGNSAMTNGELVQLNGLIPKISTGKTVMLLETRVFYEPRFKIGLADMWQYNIVPVGPRFGDCVAYDPGDGSDELCHTPPIDTSGHTDPDVDGHTDPDPLSGT